MGSECLFIDLNSNLVVIWVNISWPEFQLKKSSFDARKKGDMVLLVLPARN